MKFEKGMSEKLLWEYLHFNIFDYLEDDLVTYKHLNWFKRHMSLSPGKLTKDVEIIIKIDGKVIDNDAWEKKTK
jgi:hypothetical protein